MGSGSINRSMATVNTSKPISISPSIDRFRSRARPLPDGFAGACCRPPVRPCPTSIKGFFRSARLSSSCVGFFFFSLRLRSFFRSRAPHTHDGPPQQHDRTAACYCQMPLDPGASGLDPGRSEGAFGRNSALGVGIARDGRFLPLDGCGGQASNGPNQQAPMMLLLRMLDGRIRRTPFGPSESDAGQGQSRPMQRTDPTNARRPHHTTGRTEGLPAWVGLEGPKAHPFGSRRRGEHQR